MRKTTIMLCAAGTLVYLALKAVLLFIFFYAFCLIFDDNPKDGDVMLEEISNHQNVVVVNRWDRMNDWKNIFALDISLKNDVRMYIADCKRDKNGVLVYGSIYYINDWHLVEVVRYTNSDKYDFNRRNRAKEFLGNDSLIYLLDNYEKVYDFYMSVPEVDCVNYKNLKGTFDKKTTEFVYDVYDKETNEVIGVGKLYREKY